jgi:hypothetical protein
MDRGVLWLKLQRPPIGLHGKAGVAIAPVRGTQVVMGHGETRLQIDGMPETAYCFIQPAHVLEYVAEIVMSVGDTRIGLQCLPDVSEPFITSPLAVFHDTKEVIRRSTPGIDRQDIATNPLCLL